MMLRGGCGRGGLRAFGQQASPAAQRALLVLASARGGDQQPAEDPSRLTPSRLLGAKALSTVGGARLINWREWGSSLGGTMIVDDASHKQDVQKARRRWLAGWEPARGTLAVLPPLPP